MQRNKNTFFEENGFIVLISKNGEKIIVDKEDFKTVKEHKWCVSKTGYAVSRINNKVIKLHRFILGVKDSTKIVDHKNRNKLDNRRQNLRFCSPHQNSMNCNETKGRDLPIGVSLSSTKKRYRARIMFNRKEIFLGSFETIEEAVRARKIGEKKYFSGFRE